MNKIKRSGEILHLTETEREEIKKTLTDKQLWFFNELLKRGKKTVFANIMAKEKADKSDIDDTHFQWELEEIHDAGVDWQSTSTYYCECGRKLRYQYIVKNVLTNEVRHFGISHMQEHTGIPLDLAIKIKNGVERIDYELDELLVKFSQNWSLSVENTALLDQIDLPKDIKEHLDYDVPLLNRQIERLIPLLSENQKQINKKKQPIEVDNIEPLNPDIYRESELLYNEMNQSYTYDLFGSTENLLTNDDYINNEYELSKEEKISIIYLLKTWNKEFISVSQLIDRLVHQFNVSNKQFDSGRNKKYGNVCIYLEELVEKNMLVFVKKDGKRDWIYKQSLKEN